MKTERYRVTGMRCAACSAAVERAVIRLEGVTGCAVNLVTEQMAVTYDEVRLTAERIETAVKKAGYGIAPLSAPPAREKPIGLIVSLALSAVLLYLAMGGMWGAPLPPLFDPMRHALPHALLQLALALAVIVLGKKYYLGGFAALVRLRPNMDSLVALGGTAAFLYSLAVTLRQPLNGMLTDPLYYESAAVVVTLVSLGKTLEAGSRRKTLRAIESLVLLAPDTVHLLRPDGTTVDQPTGMTAVGDRILICPGERLPLDGTVLDGKATVDESFLTGESLPVGKEIGDAVTGGSLLSDGTLTVSVTATRSDGTLSRVVSFVEEAQTGKAPIAKTADRVAGWFVPAVMAAALIAAAVWAIAGQTFSFILRVFTSVLVIACPCAMGLATPMAVMVGTGQGARRGILIRGGEPLEATHKIGTAVFDKTGTLTEGHPTVVRTEAAEGAPADWLAWAAAVERRSAHPLAAAVVAEAERMNLPVYPLADLADLPGRGVTAHTETGDEIAVGSRRLGEERGYRCPPVSAVSGQTEVYVWRNGTPMGTVFLADTLKPTAREAIAALKAAGIRTVLLSGDNAAVAEQIGREAGVDRVLAEILPDGKAEQIALLRAESGKPVMMVGDGINDAPALAAADVGCAIGSGSEIAVQSADLVLMRDDPLDVVTAIRISRRTVRTVRQNLFWAFFYNTVALPVAAGVLYPAFGLLLSPEIAAAAMAFSSLFVVGNALRLGRKKI